MASLHKQGGAMSTKAPGVKPLVTAAAAPPGDAAAGEEAAANGSGALPCYTDQQLEGGMSVAQLRDHAMKLHSTLGGFDVLHSNIPINDYELIDWIKIVQKKHLGSGAGPITHGSSSQVQFQRRMDISEARRLSEVGPQMSDSSLTTTSTMRVPQHSLRTKLAQQVMPPEGFRAGSMAAQSRSSGYRLAEPSEQEGRGSPLRTGRYIAAIEPVHQDLETLWHEIEKLKSGAVSKEELRMSTIELTKSISSHSTKNDKLLLQLQQEIHVSRSGHGMSEVAALRAELDTERSARMRLQSEISRLEELLVVHQGRIGDVQSACSKWDSQMTLLEGRMVEKLKEQCIPMERSIIELRAREGLVERLQTDIVKTEDLLTAKLRNCEANLAELRAREGTMERLQTDVVRVEEQLIAKLAAAENGVVELRAAFSTLEGRVVEEFQGELSRIEMLEGRLPDRFRGEFARFEGLLGMEDRMMEQFHSYTTRTDRAILGLSERDTMLQKLQSDLVNMEGLLTTKMTGFESSLVELRSREAVVERVQMDLRRTEELLSSKISNADSGLHEVRSALGPMEARLAERLNTGLSKYEVFFGMEARLLERLNAELSKYDGLESRLLERVTVGLAKYEGFFGLEGRMRDLLNSNLAKFDALLGLEARVSEKLKGFLVSSDLSGYARSADVTRVEDLLTSKLSSFEGALSELRVRECNVERLQLDIARVEELMMPKVVGTEGALAEVRSQQSALELKLQQQFKSELTRFEGLFGLEGRLLGKLQDYIASNDAAVSSLRAREGLMDQFQSNLVRLEEQLMARVSERLKAFVMSSDLSPYARSTDVARVEELLMAKFATAEGAISDLRIRESVIERLQLDLAKVEELMLPKMLAMEGAVIEAQSQAGALEMRLQEQLRAELMRFEGLFALEGQLLGKLQDYIIRNDAAVSDLRTREGLMEQFQVNLVRVEEQLMAAVSELGARGSIVERLQTDLTRVEELMMPKILANESSVREVKDRLGTLEPQLKSDLARFDGLFAVEERVLGKLQDYARANDEVVGEIRTRERLMEQLQVDLVRVEEQLMADLKRVEAQLLDKTSTNEAMVTELRETLAFLERSVAEKLASELAQMESLLDSHRSQVTEASTRIAGLRLEFGQVDTRSIENERALHELQTALASQSEKTQAEWSRLEDLISIASARLGQAEGDLQKAQETLGAQQTRLSRLGDQVINLRALMQPLEGMESRVAANVARIDEAFGTLTTSAAQFGELNNELTGLRGQLSALDRHCVEKVQRVAAATDVALLSMQKRLADGLAGSFKADGSIHLESADELLLGGAAATVVHLDDGGLFADGLGLQVEVSSS